MGFSDHSEGILFSLIAAALGARVIEKHFTLDRRASGPDHRVSIEPDDLRELVSTLALIDASLGNGCKIPASVEEQGRRLSRRSIVAAVDIPLHATIQPAMLTCKRPSGGIDPRDVDKVTGAQAGRYIAKDSMLRWVDLRRPGEQ